MKFQSLQRRYRFFFISSNATPWGGSEELWAASAVALAEQGHKITVYKPYISRTHPSVVRLRELRCRIRDNSRLPLMPHFIYGLIARFISPLSIAHRVVDFALALFFTRPDLVILSQGGNYDGLPLAQVCRLMKRPYVLISQKAGEMYWPSDRRASWMRSVFTDAVSCHFVSEHNRRVTEEQIGAALPNAVVVRNPFLVPWHRRNDWPAQNGGLRLACIGRFYPQEKGQDVLIRTLARPKWRDRDVSVTFFGNGQSREGLEKMVEYYGLTSVTFGGFVDDVASIWTDHHGLVLPSRCEGLPLVLVETMLSGRVAIVTDVAGNSELVRDNVTGFLAAAPTEDALDEALERAWQRRDAWPAIGAAAADEIRTLVPPDPGQVHADMLLRIAEALAEGEAEAVQDSEQGAIETVTE